MATMTTFKVDQSLPEVRRAISLALAVLAKGARWEGSDLHVPAHLMLTPNQAALIERHMAFCRLVVPRVSVPAFCDRCGRFALQSGSASSAKCPLTVGCGGTLIGTPAAKAL